MKTDLTAVQRAYFTLLEEVKVNSMNGAEIVADLLENMELWERVVPGFTAVNPSEEFLIREAFTGDEYIDTIFIKLREGAKDKLTKLTRKWKADHIQFIEHKGETVLQVWFD
jgi:hypothetical protein